MSDISVLEMFSAIVKKVEPGKTLPTLTNETKIASLGIDSVAMMEIVGCIEDELNIVIPDEKLARLQSIGDIEKVVAEQRGNA